MYFSRDSLKMSIVERVEMSGWKDLSNKERLFLGYFDDVYADGIWSFLKKDSVSVEFVVTRLYPVLHYGFIAYDSKEDEFRLSVAEHFCELKQELDK